MDPYLNSQIFKFPAHIQQNKWPHTCRCMHICGCALLCVCTRGGSGCVRAVVRTHRLAVWITPLLMNGDSGLLLLTAAPSGAFWWENFLFSSLLYPFPSSQLDLVPLPPPSVIRRLFFLLNFRRSLPTTEGNSLSFLRFIFSSSTSAICLPFQLLQISLQHKHQQNYFSFFPFSVILLPDSLCIFFSMGFKPQPSFCYFPLFPFASTSL